MRIFALLHICVKAVCIVANTPFNTTATFTKSLLRVEIYFPPRVDKMGIVNEQIAYVLHSWTVGRNFELNVERS